MRKAFRPFGSWPSPITTELIVSEVVGLTEIRTDGDDLTWIERRPSEGGRCVIVRRRADGTVENMPSKCDRIKVEANDMLFFNTWGGGGCGDPFEREPEKVAFDVKAGLVSVKGAKRYGVVLMAEGLAEFLPLEEIHKTLSEDEYKSLKPDSFVH